MAEKLKAELLAHTWAESNTPTTASIENPHIPIGVKLTGAPLLWEQAITGKGILVGVVDTGIDSDHQDLQGKVRFVRDYIQDGTDKKTWNLHGTHVAGTIAASGLIKGVAPDVLLADYRVLTGNPATGTFEHITKAIRDAVTDGCHIINLSLGSDYDYPDMHSAIKEAVAKGVLVVAAVGNTGDGNPRTIEIIYPGYYPEVVGAASVAIENKKFNISRFSCSHKEVDVCALGSDVLSCAPDDKYATISGTSMASPHVAGFAALLRCKALLRMGLQEISEPVLYSMVKTLTVDMLAEGIDTLTGAGLVSVHPTLAHLTALLQ